MMFTKEELEMLLVALAAGGGPQGITHVKYKIEGIIKDMNAGNSGGPYRSTSIVKVDDEPGLKWIDDDLGALMDGLNITKSEKLAAMIELEGSLAERNDILTSRLRALRPLVQLQDENDRLRFELSAMGPPEALEEIEILKRSVATANGERDVLQLQVNALKTALRSERVGRMAAEGQTLAVDLDPCLRSANTRPCPHKFNYLECDICRNLLPPGAKALPPAEDA